MDNREINYLWLIVIAAVIFLIIKLFFIDFYRVKETSMCPSLKPNSTILVFKAAYGIPNPFTKKRFIKYSSPSKNDIVIYKSNIDKKLYIKRVIAVEGDTLETKNGEIIVNKKVLKLNLSNYILSIKKQIIKKGKLFLLGDNVSKSLDSRSFGTVSVEDIIGKAIFTILPLGSLGAIR